ncbi:MAG: hypothetical protein ACTIJA_07885 [Bavariicoccus seileri]|uniref:hypothetical protein n=1 Tax=Bavariicoccus seileri TaxID=549685 RepID=UPI0003B37B47|nr:hypothetical protein [Bavariicoccus seileri]
MSISKDKDRPNAPESMVEAHHQKDQNEPKKVMPVPKPGEHRQPVFIRQKAYASIWFWVIIGLVVGLFIGWALSDITLWTIVSLAISGAIGTVIKVVVNMRAST